MNAAKKTSGLSRVVCDVATAWYLLLRVPCPIPARWHGQSDLGQSRLSQSAWAFPLIGGLIGAFGGAVYFASDWMAFSPLVSSGLALAALVLVTGALHEDGFADFWDSFGGRDRARRLEIMRDSRIGTFGTLGLIFSIGLRWGTIHALRDPAIVIAVLIVAGAMSRMICLAIMWFLSPARSDGLGASASGLTTAGLLTGGIIAVASVAALLPLMAAVHIVTAMLIVSAGMVLFAKKRFAGFTGDILGAGQQFGEIVILILAVSFFS